MSTPPKNAKPASRDWFSALPDEALVREFQIVGTDPSTFPLINAGSATFWRWVRDGKAPAPVRVTAGFSAWRCGDLRRWIAELPTATTPGPRIARALAKAARSAAAQEAA